MLFLRELWSWAWPIAVTALGGIIAWIAFKFVGEPLRAFFELRKEIHRQIIFLGNVGPAHLHDFVVTSVDLDQTLFAENAEIVSRAALTLRDLGAQAIAFDQTEWLASMFVRRLGWQPMEAGRGLIALANSLEDEPTAERYRINIAQALCFKSTLWQRS